MGMITHRHIIKKDVVIEAKEPEKVAPVLIEEVKAEPVEAQPKPRRKRAPAKKK